MHRVIVLAALASLASSCAGHGPAGPAPAPADTSSFTTVLTALGEQRWGKSLGIDPRPLPSNDDLARTELPDSDSYSAPAVRARAVIVKRLGFGTADALTLQSCQGIFVLPPGDSEPPGNPHAGCPRHDETVVMVGRLRPGTAHTMAGDTYDRSTESAAVGYAAVRVVRSLRGPGGTSMSFFEFVLRPAGTGWAVARIVPLLVVE